MDSIQAAARRAGALYFLFSIMAIVGEFAFPAFTVPGDATATARNITAGELTYRIGILTGLATHILFLFVVLSLYHLLKDVDRGQARLMVIFVSTGVAVALASLLSRLAPLILLSGDGYLSAFTKPQLDALALGCLRLHGSGITVATVFWGLWLFPFGILVIRSGFLPRVLGILLMIAGFAYLASSVTSLVLPAYRHAVSQVMMPLYFGEVPIIFWLVLKGARPTLKTS
jgi:predicted transporter